MNGKFVLCNDKNGKEIDKYNSKCGLFVRKKGTDMWFDRLGTAFLNSKLSQKQLAELSQVSEKTIKRLLTNRSYSPSLDTINRVSSALGISTEDLFSDTDARVLSGNLLTIQEDYEKLSAEFGLLSAENAMLKDKVSALTSENDLLRIKLEHKDEIISLHNYYNSIKK